MLILLPPSESKQVVFEGPTFIESDLRHFPVESTPVSQTRAELLHFYQDLMRDTAKAKQVLKLGATAGKELALITGPAAQVAVPAIERYSGVLYQQLAKQPNLLVDAITDGRRLGHQVLIQSALFGLVDATDPLPYYRFSATTKVSGKTAGNHWRAAYQRVESPLAGQAVVDFRSAAYKSMTPGLWGPQYFDVSVFSMSQSKVLNHFNKKAKGELAAKMLALLSNLPDSTLESQSKIRDLVATAAENARLGVEFEKNSIRLRVA